MKQDLTFVYIQHIGNQINPYWVTKSRIFKRQIKETQSGFSWLNKRKTESDLIA